VPEGLVAVRARWSAPSICARAPISRRS
jgi:hypothetical protein